MEAFSSRRNFGWLPDLPDHRDFAFSPPEDIIKALPSACDLRPYCLPLVDQQRLNSCSANAAVSAFRFGQRRQRIPDFSGSRLFVYYNARQKYGCTAYDSGAHIRDIIKAMNKTGVCSEDRWPYDVEKFAAHPPVSCFEAALTNQIMRYSYLNNTDLKQLKSCLAEGYPFIFGFTVWSEFLKITNDGMMAMPEITSLSAGGHAVMAVGYDDARQVFILQNSQGPQWGDHGYFYMPYDFIKDRGNAKDFWTIRLVEEGIAAAGHMTDTVA